jgi:hypothetical protein
MDYKILSQKDYFTVGCIQILKPSRIPQCHGNFREENADRIGSLVVWGSPCMVRTPVNRLPERFEKFGQIISQCTY